MSIWAEVKKALNSTLGTASFKPLDQIIEYTNALIGSTADTGGSSSAGSVMAKLNKAIQYSATIESVKALVESVQTGMIAISTGINKSTGKMTTYSAISISNATKTLNGCGYVKLECLSSGISAGRTKVTIDGSTTVIDPALTIPEIPYSSAVGGRVWYFKFNTSIKIQLGNDTMSIYAYYVAS